MSLPHFHTMPKKTDPVFKNLYEVFLVDKNSNDIIDELYPDKVKLKNKKNSKHIILNYTILEKYMNKAPFSDWFRNVFLVYLVSHNKQGKILQKELIEVEFNKSEMKLSYIDSDILNYKVDFNIIKSELLDDEYEFDRKKLTREYKLKSVLKNEN